MEEPPLVIDSDDIFKHTEEIVRRLCDLLKIDYQPCMLVWPDSPVVKELFGKWEGKTFSQTKYNRVFADNPLFFVRLA